MSFTMTSTDATGTTTTYTWESLLEEFLGNVEWALGYLSQFPVDPMYATDGEWDVVKLSA